MAMSLGMSASTKMRQVQRISPQMKLSLSLLKLPINDLKEAVRKELDTNPALSGSFPLMPPRLVGLTGENGFILDNARAKGKSLVEHLSGELRMKGVSGVKAQLCEAILCELDESGMFRGEEKSILTTLRLNGIEATEADFDEARRLIMSIDPCGCGAKDLKECLLAQIAKVPVGDRERFVRGIERINEGKADAEVLPLIRKLNVRPGAAFEHVRVEYVTPDIHVSRDGEITVDHGGIPELDVSPTYVAMASNRELDAETRKYAQEKVRRAREFNEAIRRRREMMELVAQLAISGQREFLKRGPDAIRVQTMTEVCKEVGRRLGRKCSVSTVSRAAERKQVKTPVGTIPFRMFFARVDRAPIVRLREILASAPPGVKYSDEQLSQMLAKAGFKVKRRTVGNYRRRISN